jgi:trigger factor
MSAKSQSEPAVSVEATEESSVLHRLEVGVPVERVRKAYDRTYRDLARRVQVKGFRPGKTPRSVLERLYGASVAEQIESLLVQETLPDALEQAGLAPVAEPAVDSGPAKADAEFRYTARVEVKPRVELPDTSGLPARRPKVVVGEDEVERELEALRQRVAPIVEEPEGTAAAEGHILVIDFVGRIDGEPFEGGTGQGVEFELGAGRFLPEFEQQLAGASAGEDREIAVHFPDDYGSAELAGRDATFAVHVAELKRRRLPDVDDEFAKDLGDFDTLDALRQRIRDDLVAGRERVARAELRRTLMDALIERTPFEVPAGLVERELQRELRAAHERLSGQVPHETLHGQLERWKEEWRERAEREVRESLLLEAVADAEAIEPSAEEVAARVEQLAQERDVSAARLRKGFGEGVLEAALRVQLRDERALDFLASQAKVEETADS